MLRVCALFVCLFANARTPCATRVENDLTSNVATKVGSQRVADLQAQVQELRQQLAEVRIQDPVPSARVADGDSLEWLNAIVRKFWPRVDNAVNKILADLVEPLVNERMSALSSIAPHLDFETFTLGSRTPVLGPIRLYDVSDGGLKIHVNLDYQSDVDVKIRFGLLRLGVERLHVSGELVVKIAPVIDEMPVVGGLAVYFYDCPKIGLDFTGLGNVADLPGVRELLWGTVTNIISDMLVIPNIFGIPVATPAQINRALVMTSQPLGMLRVKVLRAERLAEGDVAIFSADNSDPYVQLSFGATSWSSSVVEANVNPVWGDDDQTTFMVFSREQTIRAVVWDQDWSSYHDVLGYSEMLTVGQALAHRRHVPLQLSGVNPMDPDGVQAGSGSQGHHGQLYLEFEWLELDAPMPFGAQLTTEKVVVAVQILQVEMPWTLGEPIPRVALRATVGEGDGARVQTTVAGREPVVPLTAALDAAAAEERADIVAGIVQRLTRASVVDETIANATRLTSTQVETVQAGGRAEPDPETKIYDVNRVLYFLMEREAVQANPTLHLELVTHRGELIADHHTVPLGIATLYTEPIVMHALGHQVMTEINICIHGLRHSD